MDDHPAPPTLWRSPLGIFMLLAGAVGLYYLLTEHLAHAAQAVPYLFLLACPLMHMFHGHHGHGGHDPDRRPSGEQPPAEGAERR
jgi:hypothetical protein